MISSTVDRHECEVVTSGFRLRVNVFTNDPGQVEILAKMKAAEHLKKLLGLPATQMDIRVVSSECKSSIMDRVADLVKPSAYIST